MTFFRPFRWFLIFVVLVAFSLKVVGQPQLPGDPPPAVPINGLVVLLVLLAKALGIYKIYQSKKKK